MIFTAFAFKRTMKDIRYLKGVGEKRAELFAKKGINTVEDLLYFFPRTYEDRSKTKYIADCENGETVCVSITVYSPVREHRIRRNMTVYSMIASDESGVMNVVWYNNRFVKDAFKTGEKYILYGKIAFNRNKIEMVNPMFEKGEGGKFTGKIVPIYPLTENLKQKTVQSVMETAIKEAGRLDEYIPDEVREKYKIAEINYAMRNIHFPDDFESYNTARRRFVFEELIMLQLALFSIKGNTEKKKGIVFEDTCIDEFLNSLPFPLTGAQKRTLDEILADCSGGGVLNRLVQGDVGSGKTAVAAGAIFAAVKNGAQAAMMAPTEILQISIRKRLKRFLKTLI